MAATYTYPATLTPEPEGGYTVTFRDIPEAITCGESIEDALHHAKDCLESALEFYAEDGKPLPVPSEAGPGQYAVTGVIEERSR